MTNTRKEKVFINKVFKSLVCVNTALLNSLPDLTKLHDETLEKAREWFTAMNDEMKRRFENHYGDMPNVETDYMDLSNGPAWHWWIIAILPLDPQAQVSSRLEYRIQGTTVYLSRLSGLTLQ